MQPTSQQTLLNAEKLTEHIAALGRCVVAYSGGVDSAVVAAAANRADQRRQRHAEESQTAACQRSLAVTADSPSVSREQLATARRVACELGLNHFVVNTDEINRDDYRANDRRRCFYCKQTLYQTLGDFATAHGISTLLSGTNADDLGDYRPGIEAGKQVGVVAPLADLGLTKADVRAIASLWKISVADRPAQPCLSSRLAYGVAVTQDRLKKVEQAEAFLRDKGYSPLRVRIFPGELAKIEVAQEQMALLEEETEWQKVEHYCLSLGFQAVEIDRRGFRSGSMNELVQLAAPTPSRTSM